MKIIICGAGMIGKVIAGELAKKHAVTVADNNREVLSDISQKWQTATILTDLSVEENIKKAINDFDIIINAVPGKLGYQVLKGTIEAGKNIADISFMPEDPLMLNELARERNVTAIVDCGVAPGLGNLIAGFHYRQMKLERFLCYIGGLPKIREWPFEYKAGFSPSDVIEEYTRPARYMQNGTLTVKQALSGCEMLNFEHIGSLEAFNTDGLRTLLRTLDIPDMVEKTLRYPGTVNYLKMLSYCGFFSTEPIEIDGKPIRPVDFTSSLLFRMWKMKPGDQDLTVMRILLSGMEENKITNYQYDMIDYYDQATKTTSMARTTGYTCTAMVELLAENRIKQKGIIPPEIAGQNKDIFHFVIKYLKEKGINIQVHKSIPS